MSAAFDPEAEARRFDGAVDDLCAARVSGDARAAEAARLRIVDALADVLMFARQRGAEEMRERAAVAVETRPIGTPTTVLEEAAAGFLRSLVPSVAGYIRTLPTRTDSPGEAK